MFIALSVIVVRPDIVENRRNPRSNRNGARIGGLTYIQTICDACSNNTEVDQVELIS